MFRGPKSVQQLQDAAFLINHSLDWRKTPEGEAYWTEVYYKLIDLASAANYNSPSQPVTADPNIKNADPKVLVLSRQITHIYDKDSSLCGLKGNPERWPGGNLYVSLAQKERATCLFCKAKAPL